MGDSFIIPEVKKSDAGEYICRFETSPVSQLSHNLNVQYPAKVSLCSLSIYFLVLFQHINKSKSYKFLLFVYM